IALHYGVLARTVCRRPCVDGCSIRFLEQLAIDDQRALRHQPLRRCIMKSGFSRRRVLAGLLSGASATMLAGCDRVTQSAELSALIRNTDDLAMASQRLLLGRQSLSREYSVTDISPVFRANGTQAPASGQYARWLEHGFTDWRLQVDGLVQQPLN